MPRSNDLGARNVPKKALTIIRQNRELSFDITDRGGFGFCWITKDVVVERLECRSLDLGQTFDYKFMGIWRLHLIVWVFDVSSIRGVQRVKLMKMNGSIWVINNAQIFHLKNILCHEPYVKYCIIIW